MLKSVKTLGEGGGLSAYYGLYYCRCAHILDSGHTSPTKLCEFEESASPFDIKCCLSKHGIDDVFDDGSKASPFCSIMQMAQAEVLFNDVSFL